MWNVCVSEYDFSRRGLADLNTVFGGIKALSISKSVIFDECEEHFIRSLLLSMPELHHLQLCLFNLPPADAIAGLLVSQHKGRPLSVSISYEPSALDEENVAHFGAVHEQWMFVEEVLPGKVCVSMDFVSL